MVQPQTGQPGLHRGDQIAVGFRDTLERATVGIDRQFGPAGRPVSLSHDVERHRIQGIGLPRLAQARHDFRFLRGDPSLGARFLQQDQTAQSLRIACFFVAFDRPLRARLGLFVVAQVKISEAELVGQAALRRIKPPRILEMTQRFAVAPREARGQRSLDRIRRRLAIRRRHLIHDFHHRRVFQFLRREGPGDKSDAGQGKDDQAVKKEA